MHGDCYLLQKAACGGLSSFLRHAIRLLLDSLHSIYGCRQDLSSATAAIEELFGKINDIRRKAEQSEVMVQEICRDIRKLDYAKQHLTQSITALRRFAMLCNAVGETPDDQSASCPIRGILRPISGQRPSKALHLQYSTDGNPIS